MRSLLVFIFRPDKLRQDQRRTHLHQWSVLHTQSWFWKKKRACQTVSFSWSSPVFNVASLGSFFQLQLTLIQTNHSLWAVDKQELQKIETSELTFCKSMKYQRSLFCKTSKHQSSLFCQEFCHLTRATTHIHNLFWIPWKSCAWESLYYAFTFPRFLDILYFHFLSLLQTWQML